MSEKKLFGGAYRFKHEYLMGIQIMEAGTRIHIKIDSGPRIGEYDVKLYLGSAPSGHLATNQLDGKPAVDTIRNNGQALDITWSIAAMGRYVFIMYHPLDTAEPALVVRTTLNVFVDKQAMTFEVHP